MLDPGSALLDLMTAARHKVLLVSPFIKCRTFSRVLGSIAPEVPVTCVTRWDPCEIAAGVSDLEIWGLIAERQRAELRVRVSLHAKVYQADEQCLVGSANLTHAALGWSNRPNLELMVPVAASDTLIQQFERELIASSVVADLELYECMKRASDALRTAASDFDIPHEVAEAVFTDDAGTALLNWLPSCRAPDRLFDAYLGHDDRILTSAFYDAQRDLAVLNVPRGFGRSTFNSYVAATLEQLPLIRDLDTFASVPRSRQEMTEHLAEVVGPERLQGPGGAEAWDTVKLWLLTFFPERYRIKPPEGAEVFVRGRRLA